MIVTKMLITLTIGRLSKPNVFNSKRSFFLYNRKFSGILNTSLCSNKYEPTSLKNFITCKYLLYYKPKYLSLVSANVRFFFIFCKRSLALFSHSFAQLFILSAFIYNRIIFNLFRHLLIILLRRYMRIFFKKPFLVLFQISLRKTRKQISYRKAVDQI